MEHEAVSAGWILSAMDYAGNGLNLVILDACRNNPYSRRFRGGSARGLAAPTRPATGSLIAYATAPNSVAEDGSGRNGLYTKHLLRYMQEPGLDVEDMFKKVRIAVERESGGEQTPWELSSLTGDFSFTVASTVGPVDSGDEAQGLAEERQRMAAERQRLEAERELLAEERREAQERAGREAEERRRQQEWERLAMVPVEGGSFTMGCQDGRDGDCQKDEKPAHLVQVKSFEIGKYEVTQVLWEALMGENPSYFQGCPKCPVEGVSWEDIQGFLAKLNARTEGGFRLPTEAEWEYAARGGRQSRNYKYAGGNSVGSVGWYQDNSGDRTHSVGRKGANELGLHDMSGNVLEWVQDCGGDGYRAVPADGRAWERGNCGLRVARGGSWRIRPRYLRAAYRNKFVSGNRHRTLGFRIARTLAP